MMKKLLENSYPDGIHFLIEFFGCNKKQLNSVEFWREVMGTGCGKFNIPVLKEYFYKFNPEGITGFFLLASSHLSVHTWPEYNYAACDVFSCSPQNATKKLVDFLIQHVSYDKVSIKKIKRGYKFFDFQRIINEENELVIPIFSTNKEIKIKIKNIIGKTKSDFQDILFLDTDEFGRCLVIDGIMQTAEKDHDIYDKTILKNLSKKNKNILILGGGDGYVAEMALKINSDLKIKVVDLDIEVVKGCEKHLDQKIFKNKKVHLYIEDAFNYLKNTAKHNGKFDGVICDLTDEPIRKKDQKNFSKFYEEIISLSRNVLTENGWISLQAGASKVTSGHIDAVSIIKNILEKDFKNVSQVDAMIPSFGEKNAFLYANKK
jgi:spermidine synthase